RPLDAFGMLVSRCGAPRGFGERLFGVRRYIPDRGCAHCATVALAVVGPHRVVVDPALEVRPVADRGIAPSELAHRCRVVALLEQRVRDRGRHPRVFAEAREFGEERELVVFLAERLPRHADHVARDCAQHWLSSRPMTWSIIARDPPSGAFGIAIATRFFAVGALCPHAASGVGALSTQALMNPHYGREGLDLLRAGVPAPDVVERLTPPDEG